MTKVLIVDDSVVFRKVLEQALAREPGIQVVGEARNGTEALRLSRTLAPHLLILDVEMPEMDGLTTLDELRRERLDLGVIMFSALTSDGASTTLDALAKGAFDFVPKPTGTGAFGESVKRIKQELIPKIQAFAAASRTSRSTRARLLKAPADRSGQPPRQGPRHQDHGPIAPALPPTGRCAIPPGRFRRQGPGARPEVVAIGVSTGGPNALNEVIPKLPPSFRPPVLLVQHMPPVFTAQLARRLNDRSALKVVEAEQGQPICTGTVYIAPGDYHMEVQGDGVDRTVRLHQGPPVRSCRPAVDVLFQSVARAYGGRVVAVVMTGMGMDGTEGCRALKATGATVIAQDRDSSVVWGMPRFVAEAGLADHICPLDEIAATIQASARFPKKNT